MPLVLVMSLAACEAVDPATLIDPDAPSAFTTIAVNPQTLAPLNGETLTAGQTASFNFDVFWQRSPDEMEAGASVPLQLIVESWNGESFSGQVHFEEVMTSGDKGEQRFAGSFAVPRAGTLCAPVTDLTVWVILRDTEDQIASYDGVATPVSGSGFSGPCLYGAEYGLGRADRGELRFDVSGGAGEPVLVRGWNFSDTPDPRFTGPSGQISATYLVGINEATLDGVAMDYILAWLPSDVRTGPFEMRFNGAVTPVGAGGAAMVSVAEAGVDWLEPNDDLDAAVEPDLDRLDPSVALGTLYQLNPSLTMDDVDRNTPSSVDGDYGTGDWFRITADYAADLCFGIDFNQSQDDLDLAIYYDGALLAASTTASSDESVIITGVPAGETLYAWVAPWDVKSSTGTYLWIAGDCDYFDADAVSAPFTVDAEFEPITASWGGSPPVVADVTRPLSSRKEVVR